MQFRDWKKAEAEFYRSAEHLCRLYKLPQTKWSPLPFPQNLQADYLKLAGSFGSDKGLTCLIMQDEQRQACLTTVKTFDTGYKLYYIPVRPLLKLKNRKPLFDLLMAICNYLYHDIKVGYYREAGYLNASYENVEQWIEEYDYEEDNTENLKQKGELEALKTGGDELLPFLKTAFSLPEFDRVVRAYKEKKDYDSQALSIAQEIIKLATDYPGRSIPVPENIFDGEENDRIYFEQYVSFYWSCNDCFQDILMDMVNNEFQEMGSQEEPVSVQWFDEPQTTEHHEFNFETRLFSLISEFIDLMNDYDEEYNP